MVERLQLGLAAGGAGHHQVAQQVGGQRGNVAVVRVRRLLRSGGEQGVAPMPVWKLAPRRAAREARARGLAGLLAGRFGGGRCTIVSFVTAIPSIKGAYRTYFSPSYSPKSPLSEAWLCGRPVATFARQSTPPSGCPSNGSPASRYSSSTL